MSKQADFFRSGQNDQASIKPRHLSAT